MACTVNYLGDVIYFLESDKAQNPDQHNALEYRNSSILCLLGFFKL